MWSRGLRSTLGDGTWAKVLHPRESSSRSRSAYKAPVMPGTPIYWSTCVSRVPTKKVASKFSVLSQGNTQRTHWAIFCYWFKRLVQFLIAVDPHQVCTGVLSGRGLRPVALWIWVDECREEVVQDINCRGFIRRYQGMWLRSSQPRFDADQPRLRKEKEFIFSFPIRRGFAPSLWPIDPAATLSRVFCWPKKNGRRDKPFGLT